ncbi:hypothetical protein [Bacillus velezensis]
MNYKIVNESTLIDTLERHLNSHLLDDVLERLSDEISTSYEQMIIVHVRKDDGGEMVANLYFHFRVMEEYEDESENGEVFIEFVMYDPHVIRKDYEATYLKNGGR